MFDKFISTACKMSSWKSPKKFTKFGSKTFCFPKIWNKLSSKNVLGKILWEFCLRHVYNCGVRCTCHEKKLSTAPLRATLGTLRAGSPFRVLPQPSLESMSALSAPSTLSHTVRAQNQNSKIQDPESKIENPKKNPKSKESKTKNQNSKKKTSQDPQHKNPKHPNSSVHLSGHSDPGSPKKSETRSPTSPKIQKFHLGTPNGIQ